MTDTTIQTAAPFLNHAQREQFIKEGYTVAPGLIPHDLVQTTLDDICRAMGIERDDKSTWPEKERTNLTENLEITEPCCTRAFEDTARELVGDVLLSQWRMSAVLDQQGKNPWGRGFVPVMAYPREGERKFVAEWPGRFHLDGIHLKTLWPDKILLVALIYLTNTTEYGGATAVIPGSHRKIFEYWMQSEEAPTAKTLMRGLENPQPIPVPGQAGDVIFMHHLLAHSGTPNCDDHIRFALNTNFACDPARPYQRKTGVPTPNWTPLDWTLRTDNLR
jgi:hypothetical protein